MFSLSTKFSTSRIAAALVLGLGATGSVANLVSNPGFETGSFSPWVKSGDGFAAVSTASTSGFQSFFPRSGTYYAELGNVGPGGGDENPTYLTQSVSGLSAGSYTLSYYYAIFDMPLDGCWISTSLGGVNAGQITLYASSEGGGYYQATQTLSLPTNTASTGSLQFALQCDWSALAATIGLDDITLTKN
ncbi:hypothetical protein GQ53DRAFT_837485 [Thozetella sp. PMI_491]|nr:hypothetical protein GQ53DRAFT_837485 [Thozetella sp. PMI_491]